MVAVLAGALPGPARAQPVTEAAVAAALGQQDGARQRLQDAERRLAQARAEAQREAEAIGQRLRAETAPLARRVEMLQAAPARAAPPVEEPERLRELRRLLAEREAQLARLAEARDRAATEVRRAQAQADIAGSGAMRAAEAARRAAGEEARAEAARARLAAPDAAAAGGIRDEARRQLPAPLVDAAMRQTGDAIAAILAAAQRAPVEPERNGRFLLREMPAGRWWAVGLTADRRDIWDIWEMTVSRDGLMVLGAALSEALTELAPNAPAPRRGGAYDTCLLENLRGTASDMAAAAIISACRARHPDEARYEVTVEVRQGERPPLLVPMTAAEVRDVSAALAAGYAMLDPETDRIARRLLGERLQRAEEELQAAIAVTRSAEAALAARRGEAEQAARLVPELRAVAEEAARAVEAYRAEPEADALATELARLAAALSDERAAAASRIEAERDRLREELATVQAELRQAEQRIRAAEEPRRQRAAQAEAAAAAELEAARRATAAADAEVPRLRRSLAERWREDYLRQRVTVSLSIVPQYSSSPSGDQMICASVQNAGDLVLVRPRLTFRFRGRTLSEMGVAPNELARGLTRLETPTVSYQNRFNESVTGLRPGTTWGARPVTFGVEANCAVLSASAARTGDTGRAFERAGGFSTALQDWSVSLAAELARPDDLREVAAPLGPIPRQWEHVPRPPETLFAERLAAIRPAPAGLPAAQADGVPAEPAHASPAAGAASIGVAEAQRRLRDLGFYRGALDGMMGPGTRGAVRSFERDRGLPETGELAGRTAEALLAIP
jgi:peptidoglycan hydrolase-like protein with peptidoglycan-binding domain